MTLCAKFGSESRSFDSDLVEYLVPLPSVCGVPVRPAPVRAGSIQSSTLPPSAAASRTGSDRCLCSFISVRRSEAPPFVLLARAGPAEDHRVRRHRSVAGNPGGQSTSSASRSCAESSTPRLSACFFVCVPCVAPSRFLSAVWRPAADSYLSPSALRVRELPVASCCPCFALAEWNFALLRRCSYFRHLCMGSSSSRSSLQIDFERQVQQPVLASFRL